MRHADLYVNAAAPRCIELGRVRTRNRLNIKQNEKRQGNGTRTDPW